ncbi:thiamine pyrophosphate-binding protein [Amylibacter sp. IMCC11727]|uniref:thiamine pyrophosphate-binding protein n=1 Tax=Amylibacter sp. IMCC11727 TaxID=3039851 RepID=UPI00244E13DD|nr:thiamine pyrophosphate-binding protein [Amylibacter sp. IMCC11727]WGI23245.1 thiamine pyrophosphate-binding protein [Amylibacter sp. IMCC11727]
MPSTKRTVDYLAERLFEAGCRRAYGMPGGEVLTLVNALAKAGIEFVLVKHENSAAFMAEGDYHRTGAPGILVATLGPGAMNGVNAIANALQDRVPMIVLTGCVDADEAQTYTHQVMDHSAVFSAITKQSFRLTVDSCDIIADRAVNLATDPRLGPVHIDVPIAVANATVSLPKLRRRSRSTIVVPTVGPDLDQARDWVATAKRPVMIVGVDAMNDGAGADIKTFCETHSVPFITTYKAKGIVKETHPLCLGGAGLSPLADQQLLPFVRAADLILLAGYDPIEMRPGWREVWDPNQTNVIDISSVANDHYMHQSSLSFVADTGATLSALLGNAGQSTWPDGEIAAVKAALAGAFPEDEAWGPAAIIDECRQVMPENTLATADSGAHRILLSQMWPCYEPRGLMQSSAFCTMGCAVPLAMGAKIASPDRPVVSFSGDAGFLMVAGELATAKELEIKPIFVVFVDASLALIELKQRQNQMQNQGVDFGHHDFAAIGQAFGGVGVSVSSRAALRDALKAAQSADTFTVIAAQIDRGAYDGRI